MLFVPTKSLHLATALTALCLGAMVMTATAMAAPPARDPSAQDDAVHDTATAIAEGAHVARVHISKLHLSDEDVLRYRKLFAARKRGDTEETARLEHALDDKSLIDWTRAKHRNGHPNAGAAMWPADAVAASPRIYRTPIKRDAIQSNAARNIALSVALLLKTDDIDRATGVVHRARTKGTIDRVETAKLWAQIAAARLYANEPAAALSLAHLALQIGGMKTPEAAWTAGLASWVNQDYKRAAQYFAWAPRSPYADSWLRSASSFWAGRALMRTGHYAEVSAWLREAARHPRSFYGLIATRALGARFDFNWQVAPLSERHIAVLAQYPGAVRALKLAQLGRMDMARLELAMLDDGKADKGRDANWRDALASLAAVALKPDVVIQVAGLLRHPSGGTVDTALYPIAPWEPKDGYRLEPALMNAFMRQESRFKTAAFNKDSGATGLLQIMPRTARAMDKSTPREALKDPETSLMLGQKYLEELLDRTDGNLFEAAIAYNAGPGNLATWKQRFAGINDPLLFIELIPYGETRGYVERVMANYWIYSLRMGPMTGGGVASLDAVAAGQPARYVRATNRNDPRMLVGAASENALSPR